MIDEIIAEEHGARIFFDVFSPIQDEAAAADGIGNRDERDGFVLHPEPRDFRHERNPESGADESADGLRIVTFQRNFRRESRFVAVNVRDGAQTFSNLQKQKGVGGKIAEIHCAVSGATITFRHGQ